MKPRVIYVLTSAGNDKYSVMTRVSAASVRISNPGLPVVLACDRLTLENLELTGDPLLSEIDDCLAYEANFSQAAYRNRYIKTRLRNLVEGQFLFLDSDVLVRKRLTELFAIDKDVAAVVNHSTPEAEAQVFPGDRDTLNAMNWRYGQGRYFNGGVLLFNDTANARLFSEAWARNWALSSSATGVYRDQPAMNYSMYCTEVSVESLDVRYNAQVRVHRSGLDRASIWHFYSSSELDDTIVFEKYIQDIIAGKALEQNAVKQMIASDSPFRKSWFRDFTWVGNILRTAGLKSNIRGRTQEQKGGCSGSES